MLPLLRRRYRLWMLSNTNAAHVEYIRRTTRVFRLFERTFFSHKLKMIKPSSRLFSLVNSELKRSGFKPSEVLFLDDAVENRRAARKAGWRVLAAVTNRPVGPLLERALGA
jgi:putative hydrolase of the HAD superfamily